MLIPVLFLFVYLSAQYLDVRNFHGIGLPLDKSVSWELQ